MLARTDEDPRVSGRAPERAPDPNSRQLGQDFFFPLPPAARMDLFAFFRPFRQNAGLGDLCDYPNIFWRRRDERELAGGAISAGVANEAV